MKKRVHNRASIPDNKQQQHVTKEQRVLRDCDRARVFEEGGDYESACQTLSEWWLHSSKPNTDGLGPRAAAKLLLMAGVLTGHLVSAKQTQGAQTHAKELIAESICLFEQAGQIVEAEEAKAELGRCLMREGDSMSARRRLSQAIAAMNGLAGVSRAKAIALLYASVIELESGHPYEALILLRDSAPLFNVCNSRALKGRFHNNLGLAFQEQYEETGRKHFLELALREYRAANSYFETGRLKRLLAHSQNNMGYVLFLLKDFEEADNCLCLARKLFTEFKDTGHVAQVNETQARLHLAKGEPDKALRFASDAAGILEGGERPAVLSEALTTKGVALARTRKFKEARESLNHAIEVAEAAAWEMGGLAMLSVLEELRDELDFAEARKLYERACSRLTGTRRYDAQARLNEVARWIIAATHRLDTSALRPIEGGSKSVTCEAPSLREIEMRLSGDRSPLLITGRSAEIRRLLARYAHELSGLSGPLVIMDCCLLENDFAARDFFGRHAREAANGTLFLDKVHELSRHNQSRLLQLIKDSFIEYGRARRREHIDVRVVAGTSCDLLAAVEKGFFLPELFDELSGSSGPLRTPSQEVLESQRTLFSYYVKEKVECCYPAGAKKPEEVALLLRTHPAETVPVLIRKFVRLSAKGGHALNGGRLMVTASALVHAVNDLNYTTLDEAVRDVERKMICQALEDTNRNKAQAAGLLGVDRRKLDYMLKTKYPDLHTRRKKAQPTLAGNTS